MNLIPELENSIGKSYDEIGINATFGQAYFTLKYTNNNLLDLADTIWEREVEGLVEDCKKFGVDQFTISSPMSRITEVLRLFADHGVKLVGLTEVNSEVTDFFTGNLKRIPAFLMQVSE